MPRFFTETMLTVLACALSTIVEAQQLSPLQASDYGKFENLDEFKLSPDGAWLVSTITRVDGTTELRLKRSNNRGEEIILEHGMSPEFSADADWMAYRSGVHPEVSAKSEEPIHDKLGLVDLIAGTDSVLFTIENFAFQATGPWLAALRPIPSEEESSDLVVMNPSDGSQTFLGNVDAYHWQDRGDLLAATIKSSQGTGNAVVILNPSSQTRQILDSGDGAYNALSWREGSNQLSVMRAVNVDGMVDHSNDVLNWIDVTDPTTLMTFFTQDRSELSENLRITDYTEFEYNSNGKALIFGVKNWDKEENPEEDEVSGVGESDVQIWHWDDNQIIRSQEYGASRLAQRSHTTIWDLNTDEINVLGEELDESVRVVNDIWGIVSDFDPYDFERRFGDSSADIYRVNLQTGHRDLIVESAEFAVQSHSESSNIVFYHRDQWLSTDLTTLETNILAGGRNFTQSLEDHDYPGTRPPWGFGGWVKDSDMVLIYDKNDIWMADLDGSTHSVLTNGVEEDEIYRLIHIDPELSRNDPFVSNFSEPIWASVRNERTKDTGYVTINLSTKEVVNLINKPAAVSALARARDSEVYALRVETWEDSPNVFVAGPDLEGLTQITNTNPFQKEYAWGKSRLIEYTTDAGHDLQGVLIYPANFDSSKTYPLILYQYERLSDGLHRYQVPSERVYYSHQAWSQNGYFVLLPDIIYEPGRPGPSALDAVESVLDTIETLAYIDSNRIGLIGHSWGGYQATYLPTRTDRFAASVAGAAITNFLSFMGAVHWNGGLPETGHWETGQARMAVPYWENMETHLESSPANFIADLNTPILLMHGDDDGVVDFYQGLEFYNYGRRAGKEVVLLVYPEADHGLRVEEQQVDYHRRILNWFGHYLKGEPAETWITEGESWIQRLRRIGS